MPAPVAGISRIDRIAAVAIGWLGGSAPDPPLKRFDAVQSCTTSRKRGQPFDRRGHDGLRSNPIRLDSV